MDIVNIDKQLAINLSDEKVGVKVVPLTGDEMMTVFAIELMENQFLPAHYHEKGIETYQILAGSGTVSLGRVEKDQAMWEADYDVQQGDCFTIEAGQVHKIKNTSGKALCIVACSPLSHSGEDGYFVTDKNELKV